MRLKLINDEFKETVLAQGSTRQINCQGIARFTRLVTIGEFGYCFVNHPPVQRRHQIVALRSRNELVRPYKQAIFITHAQQDFVVTTAVAVFLTDSNDWLEEQLEALFFNCTRNSRYPFHLFMAKRRIAVSVKVNLISAHVFG